jgi:hypothetical protein
MNCFKALGKRTANGGKISIATRKNSRLRQYHIEISHDGSRVPVTYITIPLTGWMRDILSSETKQFKPQNKQGS